MANNILAHEQLFRLSIVNELIGLTMIFLVIVLYRRFNGADKILASLLVIFGTVVSTPIFFLNVLNEIAARILIREADFLSVFTTPQREALASLFLRWHGQGFLVEEIFWGLWLIPFVLLMIRSSMISR